MDSLADWYEYAITFQERMHVDGAEVEFYKERAVVYVGKDVSPDCFAWIFSRCGHVAVGTGAVVDREGTQKYQAMAKRSEGGACVVGVHNLAELFREGDAKCAPTFFVLDALQRLSYTSGAACESFVGLCEGEYVQKMTFCSCLFLAVMGSGFAGDVELLGWALCSTPTGDFTVPAFMERLWEAPDRVIGVPGNQGTIKILEGMEFVAAFVSRFMALHVIPVALASSEDG